jgi:hypothetical protein
MNALTRFGFVLLGALATGWACEPSECTDDVPEAGLLSDTPRPVPCTTDSVVFSPSRAALTSTRAKGQTALVTPPVGGSAAAGNSTGGSALGGSATAGSIGAGGSAPEPGGAVDELEMAVIAQTANGQPRDTVSLNIQVCGPQALVDLKPADDSVEGKCRKLTNTQLECSTSAAGVARFVVVHGQRGSGTVQLCAMSGTTQKANAIISVTDISIEDLALRVATDKLGFGSHAGLNCEPQKSVSCGDRSERSTSVRVAVLDAAGAEAAVATAQQVEISVSNDNPAGAVGVATDDCATAGTSVSTSVNAGASVSIPVLLCLDARHSEFELTATVAGKSRTERFQVDAIPRSVNVEAADPANPDGPKRLSLLDCDENALASRPFVWRIATGATQMASTDVLGGFLLPDGSSGQVEVGVSPQQGSADFIRCKADL